MLLLLLLLLQCFISVAINHSVISILSGVCPVVTCGHAAVLQARLSHSSSSSGRHQALRWLNPRVRGEGERHSMTVGKGTEHEV